MNALPPIVFTESGITILVREMQPRNAALPILVTESGIFTLLREVQPENAPSLILVTESGITRSVTSSPLRYKLVRFWKASW